MRSSKALLLTLTAWLLWSAPAFAQDMFLRKGSAEALAKECRAVLSADLDKMQAPADAMWPIGSCLGFLNGVIDMATIAREESPKTAQFFCIPRTVTGAQLAKVFVKYSDNHPEQLHLPAAVIVVLSFKDAFPCS